MANEKTWAIRAGQIWSDDGFYQGDLAIGRQVLATVPPDSRVIDAGGLLVLPGMVDIHGDAFERQLAPRPGVYFNVDMALYDTDRQVIANGITTVLHGLTWSWEPGLRGPENAHAFVQAVSNLSPKLAARTLVHLRHETFNLDAEDCVVQWIRDGRIAALAFNDHMSGTIKRRNRPDKIGGMVKRSGLSPQEFDSLIERTWARRDEVPSSVERLAAAARSASVPLLSHDDTSAEQRQWYRGLGCRIAEFPVNEATAMAAAAAGDHIVFGAPNVVRGGSHIGCPSAAEMIARRLCSVLASDYFYPALLAAPFRLAADNILPLERAWRLVSTYPAQALNLASGNLSPGALGDVILVDADEPSAPRVVATFVGGRLVYCTESTRIH